MDKLTRRLSRLANTLQRMPRDAHKEFVKETPVDTGNAKRRTDLRGTEIRGNYPYSVRLNEGYSRQAPKGMTEPVIDFIRDEIRKL